MGRKMGNAPVYYAVVQARHNPVLSLGEFIPAIQESMRRAGYPDYKQSVTLAFNVVAGVSSDTVAPPQPQVQQVRRYIFSNAEATAGFLLHPDSISFQVTEYGTFDTFSGEFLKALDIVHKALTLNYVERLGLRYLDAVVPRQGEMLKQYIVPELSGLPPRMPTSVFRHSFAESLMQLPGDQGLVMSRVIMQAGRVRFPPDLQPEPLKVASRFVGIDGEHAVLDTDGYFEGRESFSSSKIIDRLGSLHDGIDAAFRSSVTPHALAVWK